VEFTYAIGDRALDELVDKTTVPDFRTALSAEIRRGRERGGYDFDGDVFSNLMDKHSIDFARAKGLRISKRFRGRSPCINSVGLVDSASEDGMANWSASPSSRFASIRGTAFGTP
jgi:hypothetical protein